MRHRYSCASVEVCTPGTSRRASSGLFLFFSSESMVSGCRLSRIFVINYLANLEWRSVLRAETRKRVEVDVRFARTSWMRKAHLPHSELWLLDSTSMKSCLVSVSTYVRFIFPNNVLGTFGPLPTDPSRFPKHSSAAMVMAFKVNVVMAHAFLGKTHVICDTA